MDDLRPTGPSLEECWRAASQTARVSNNRGVQDATRKRRDSSQTPGAWAGSIIRTDQGQVRSLVSQEKWDKTKMLLKETKKLLTNDREGLPRKRLEEIRGFLNYVAQTYDLFASHLIGFHITIDGWRENRDEDG